MPLPGNVRDLLKARLGVPTRARVSSPVISGAPVIATPVKQDAARVGIMFVNVGAFQVFIVPNSGGNPPSANIGIKVEPNGGSLVVTWEEDGEITAWEWLATANGGTTIMFVVETIIDEGRQPVAAPAA